jgi:DNA invertase Pin-like site-specific DNA recombinase
MSKITAEHLARRACVYIRQSTPDQVQNNLESQRRQYALVDRARQLGWQEVEVIDEDLGRSGFFRELRALGATQGVARRVAANSRSWWRNSAKLLNSVLTIAHYDRLGVPRLS